MATVKTGVASSVTVSAGIQTALWGQWIATSNRDVLPYTTWADATNEESAVGGMMRVTGSLDGFADAETMPVLTQLQEEDTDGDTLTLLTSAGKSWAFSAIFSDLTITCPKIDLVRLQANFRSNGAITYASA